jgi:hypothetical protein
MRWLPFVAVGALLFALALNDEVYAVTSPPEFAGHVLLRKLYSVVAFACVAASYRFARRRAGTVEMAAVGGLYSGAIEIGQWFTSEESLRWNLFDVGCGILGGLLAAAVINLTNAVRGR